MTPMSKRKLPDNITTPETPVDAASKRKMEGSVAIENVPEVPITPPRSIKKGSPADQYLQSLSPSTVTRPVVPETMLTCDLAAMPKEKWNRKFTLAAIVIGVQPVIKNESATRRNVVLRDEDSECMVCLWNNATTVITEDCIGRPVLLLGVTLKEYEGKPQLKLPKTSSISIGIRPETRGVQEWFHYAASNVLSVTDATKLVGPQVISVSGVVARFVEQTIVTLSGEVRNLVTVYIGGGPPLATIGIQFWNPPTSFASECQSVLLRPVVVTKLRAYLDNQRGSTFESIGNITTIAFKRDDQLEKWWFEGEE